EEFSLHYQRSLFSSFTSLVRETWQSIGKLNSEMPESLKADIRSLSRETLLSQLKRIHSKKLDVQKSRIHGNYGLSHILFTGKDIILHDFSGNPTKAFTDRRLKRSPLRDAAAMIRSFYYVAYEGFLNTTHVQNGQVSELFPFADFWAHYVSGFFMKAYLEKIKGHHFVPENQEDLEVMVQTYVLENSLHYFNLELQQHPKRAIIPLRIIRTVVS
ncbi:MAG TPA: alpha-amylase, partial [Flavisolibacter sp.]|nr:alpha-amylase [Flavisolibacter sp.]